MAGGRRRSGDPRPTDAVRRAARSTRPPDARLDAIVFSARDLERARSALARQAAFALSQFDRASYLDPTVKRERLAALRDGFGLTEDDLTDIRRAGALNYRDEYGELPEKPAGEFLEYTLGGYARLLAAKDILANSRIGLDRATAEHVWASEAGAAGRRLTDLLDLRAPMSRERGNRRYDHNGWGWAGGSTVTAAITAALAAASVPVLPWVAGAAAAFCLLGCVATIGERLALGKRENAVRADARAASADLHEVLRAVPARPTPARTQGAAR